MTRFLFQIVPLCSLVYVYQTHAIPVHTSKEVSTSSPSPKLKGKGRIDGNKSAHQELNAKDPKGAEIRWFQIDTDAGGGTATSSTSLGPRKVQSDIVLTTDKPLADPIKRFYNKARVQRPGETDSQFEIRIKKEKSRIKWLENLKAKAIVGVESDLHENVWQKVLRLRRDDFNASRKKRRNAVKAVAGGVDDSQVEVPDAMNSPITTPIIHHMSTRTEKNILYRKRKSVRNKIKRFPNREEFREQAKQLGLDPITLKKASRAGDKVQKEWWKEAIKDLPAKPTSPSRHHSDKEKEDSESGESSRSHGTPPTKTMQKFDLNVAYSPGQDSL